MLKSASQIFIYSDASFCRRSQLAVLGCLIFKNKKQHEESCREDFPIRLTEIKETNNIRAEIRGAIKALELGLSEKSSQIVLYTDCQTVSGLIARREKLEKSQFISKSKNKLLANADLYKEFYKIYDVLKPQILWLKGHTAQSKAGPVETRFSFLDKAVRRRLRDLLEI
jgi:ribonuclease HI